MNLQQPQQMSLPPMYMTHTGPCVNPPSMNSHTGPSVNPPSMNSHTGPSVNPPSISSNTFTLPAQNSTSHVQTNNSTLQMLFNTINQMNQRLNNLDMLDDLCATLSNMGKYVSKLYNDILDIRDDLRQQSQRSFGRGVSLQYCGN